MKSMYVVTAYRYGNRSAHSYVVGIFTTKRKAIRCADKEVQYRGGYKYSCEVNRAKIDDYDQDSNNCTEAVYLSKGGGHLEHISKLEQEAAERFIKRFRKKYNLK